MRFLLVPGHRWIPRLREVHRVSFHIVRNTTTIPAVLHGDDIQEARLQASGNFRARRLAAAARASVGAHPALLPFLPKLHEAVEGRARRVRMGVAYAANRAALVWPGSPPRCKRRFRQES